MCVCVRVHVCVCVCMRVCVLRDIVHTGTKYPMAKRRSSHRLMHEISVWVIGRAGILCGRGI